MLSWNGSQVVYTPSPGFSGTDGFAYAVRTASLQTLGYFEIDVLEPAASGTVVYYCTGEESGTPPVDSNSYSPGATVTVLGNVGNLFRTGHALAGWNTAPDGSGTGYAVGSSFTIGTSGVILFAQWLAVPTYVISYHGNGHTAGTVPASQVKTHGVGLTLTPADADFPQKSGDHFISWNTAQDGSGNAYSPGVQYTVDASVTLYAQWSQIPIYPPMYTANMDANPGWTLDAGWAYGQPTGANQDSFGNPDPTAGFDGDRVIGYRLDGDYEVSIPSTRWATTPSFDCSNRSNVTLRFQRWLGVEQSQYDHAFFQVSNNGTDWVTVWENPNTNINDSSWASVSYDISAVADNQPNVKVRWGMGGTDVSLNGSGWNIDNVVVEVDVTKPIPVDHFNFSAIGPDQVAGVPIQGITLTARDANNNIATGFNGTVDFGGTAGITGRSSKFVNGVLAGVSLTPTVVGAGATLTVTDTYSNTGSVTFNVLAAPGTYAYWSQGLASGADSNGDGISNGVAWVLGVANPSAHAASMLPTIDNTTDATHLIFSYRRLAQAHNDPNTTILMEYGDSLGVWTTARHDNNDVIITETRNGYGTGVDRVDVKIRRSLYGSRRLFGRLNVTITE